jgi:hypothetical protein
LTESQPCYVEDGELKMCVGLQGVVEYSCRKGIKSQMFMNFKTGKSWYALIALSGDYVKKGLVMNFCPFCGEDIISHTPVGQQRKDTEHEEDSDDGS